MFPVSGFLQFTITPDMATSGVFFAFGLTTALVCGLMLNTMMICTLIQASILKTGRKFVSEWEEARFVNDCLVRVRASSAIITTLITTIITTLITTNRPMHAQLSSSSHLVFAPCASRVSICMQPAYPTAAHHAASRQEWFAGYTPGKRPPQPQKMFSRHWEQQCESDWVRAFFMFSAGARQCMYHHWRTCLCRCSHFLCQPGSGGVDQVLL